MFFKRINNNIRLLIHKVQNYSYEEAVIRTTPVSMVVITVERPSAKIDYSAVTYDCHQDVVLEEIRTIRLNKAAV